MKVHFIIEITRWLVYCCTTVLEAQMQSQILIDFLIAKTKLYDRLRGQLNQRQQHALARVFREGPDGFKGGMSVANYIAITGAARATAARDLVDLVRKGALIQTGMLKSTRYWLSMSK
jgi:Fic family protein